VNIDCIADILKAGASDMVGAVDNSHDKGRKVYVRKYRPMQDDMEWARIGVVATICNGGVTPVVRNRIIDAGFTDVYLIHLGAD
jgi:hypothetical protein